MKLLIAGSREFSNYSILEEELKDIKDNITEVISGTARGADRIGENYARRNKIKIKRFPADWDRFGKRAGYIRNVEMGEYCDEAIIFWNGKSRGTKHMIDILESKGKQYKVVYFEEV